MVRSKRAPAGQVPGERDPASVGAPAVSVVVAAYNHSHLLRHALASILAQDFQDFEVLVIGDACTDESGAVVASFNDARLTFENLPMNFGDQSGPDNVGIARARGRYIAFLNQDDMWLPDHLSVCVEWLEATGADIVHAVCAGVSAASTADDAGRWLVGAGSSVNGRFYDPVRNFAPCSCWLVRAGAFDRIGVLRPALECTTGPSEDWLFRAWRAGLVHRIVPNLSVVVVASGERQGSYLNAESREHEVLAGLIAAPDGRAYLLARMAAVDPTRSQRLRSMASAAVLRPLAWLGVSPRALRHRIRHGYRRGDFIGRLRKVRGLDPIWHGAGGLVAIRLREIADGRPYRLGTKIGFGLESGATSIRERGWSFPETDATWTEGSRATVVFNLADVDRSVDLDLTVEAIPFISPRNPRQRVVFRVGETVCGEVSLDAAESTELPPVAIPAAARPEGRLLRITMDLPDARAPARLGISGDVRRLGLCVSAMTLRDRGSSDG